MKPLICHDHQCGTACNARAMVETPDETRQVTEHRKTPPSRSRWVERIAMMEIPARDLLRREGMLCDDFNLADPARTDTQLMDAMLAHPVALFTKENGSVVRAAGAKR